MVKLPCDWEWEVCMQYAYIILYIYIYYIYAIDHAIHVKNKVQVSYDSKLYLTAQIKNTTGPIGRTSLTYWKMFPRTPPPQVKQNERVILTH